MWWGDAFCRVFWNGNGPQLEVRGDLGKPASLTRNKQMELCQGSRWLLKLTHLLTGGISEELWLLRRSSLFNDLRCKKAFHFRDLCFRLCVHQLAVTVTKYLRQATQQRRDLYSSWPLTFNPWLPWACPETGRFSGEHGGAKQLSARRREGGREGECFKAYES